MDRFDREYSSQRRHHLVRVVMLINSNIITLATRHPRFLCYSLFNGAVLIRFPRYVSKRLFRFSSRASVERIFDFTVASAVKKENDDQQHAASSFDSPEGLMTMLSPDDVVLDPPDEFISDGIASSFSAQIFDFCNNQLFPADTMTTSKAASCSNCGFDENLSFMPPTTTAAMVDMATTLAAVNNCSNMSMIFDPQDDIDINISASMNFSPSGPFSVPPYLASAAQENQFGISPIQPQTAPSDPSFFNTNPFSSAAPCTLLDISLAPYLLDNLSPTLPEGFSGSNLFIESKIPQSQILGYREDSNSYFCTDSMQMGFYSAEIQPLCSESARQLMMSGARNPNLSMTSEITSMEEPSYKVGKISVEQRKEKIHRYLKKKTERNFGKKIKYACRKTLADSRPRVRGRFAKNDEYGQEQSSRANYNHHEDDEYFDEDDYTLVNTEDVQLLSSSDIFSHIGGVNAFNYNFPVQSRT